MKKFEEELNYLIELSGKVLTGQIEAEEFENHRVLFICKNIVAMKDVANKMRDLAQENESLKAQLEKQKPEIPRFVAEWLEEERKAMRYNGLFDIIGNTTSEIHEWLEDTSNHDLLAQAWLNGYTVKEKLFFLKNKLTGGYIAQDCYNGTRETYNSYDRTFFTQAEIDNMETGSYEIIEVEE